MKKRTQVCMLAATLLCVAPALMGAAAPDTTLEIGVYQREFAPKTPVTVTIKTKGYSRVLCAYPSWMNVTPSKKEGVTISVVDGIVQFDITHPEANLNLSMKVTLPEDKNATYRFVLKGITPEGRLHQLEPYTITTNDFEVASLPDRRVASENLSGLPPAGVKTAELGISSSPRSIFDDEDDAPYDENDTPFTRGRLNIAVAGNRDLFPIIDEGKDLGLLRTFFNTEIAALTRVTPVVASKEGNLDLGPSFAYYTVADGNSHSSEPLADGSSFMRFGLLSRWYTDSTVIEFGPGINFGFSNLEKIKNPDNILSGMVSWRQRLPLDLVGLKGKVAENTAQAVVNGPLLSYSVRDRLDIPLDTPNTPKGRSHYYVSLGTRYISNKPWMDWQTWGGLTIRFGALNSSLGLAFPENGKSVYTESSLTLEGANRKIR